MRPKRSLGQNFLVDPGIQKQIVDRLEAGPDDEVLEIGPGKGALTRHLVGSVRRLVLVELDDALAADLEARYGHREDVRIVHADILDLPLTRLLDRVEAGGVVGNIPYNITTPILFHLLGRPRPRRILVTVQREVADRLTAEPGTSEYGALSVGVRSVATCERVLSVSRYAFRPVPRVDSAVVRIDPLVPEPMTPAEESRLRSLVRAVFQWRRKQLQKTLRDHPDLRLGRDGTAAIETATGYDLTRRPESLSPDEFKELASRLPLDPQPGSP